MINYANRLTDLISGCKSHDNKPSNIVLEYLEKYPIAAQQINIQGLYPLNIACHYRHCGSLVQMKLIELCTVAVTKPDIDGYYPLHI